jgi:hypothetical protein
MPKWASRPHAERWHVAQEIRARYGPLVRDYEEQRAADYAEGERRGWTRNQTHTRLRRGAVDESPNYAAIAAAYGTTHTTIHSIIHGRRFTGPRPARSGTPVGQRWERASVWEEAAILEAVQAGYGPSAIARALTRVCKRPVSRQRVSVIAKRLRREGRLTGEAAS